MVRDQWHRRQQQPDTRKRDMSFHGVLGGWPKMFWSVWLPSAQANSSDSTSFGARKK
jgi:hypothetical protein